MRLCVMKCHVMQHVRVWHDLLFFICPKSPAASSGCFNKGLYMTSDEDFISLSKFFAMSRYRLMNYNLLVSPVFTQQHKYNIHVVIVG